MFLSYNVRMRKYNLIESAQLLGVSLSTLRRWRIAAGGAGARGAADGRRVWLSRAELVDMARGHGRVVLDSAPGADVAALAAEVETLRARVETLETWRWFMSTG